MELYRGGSLFGGALLVAGTAIGAGMLALPVLTAAGGFLPSLLVYLLCWIFMCSTALLMLEVVLWRGDEINIISMAEMTLGRFGKIFAWIVYIALFYLLLIAYVAGGGHLFNDIFNVFGCMNISKWSGPILFVLVFAPFVIIGARLVDRLNTILMGGLFCSFVFFVFLGSCSININLFKYTNFPRAMLSLPVVFISFGFQGIVPTLINYLDRDIKRIRKAIIIGSAIPLLVYVIWEALILGIVPQEQLDKALKLGQSAIFPLQELLPNTCLFYIGESFAFFALVTSFLGVTLPLIDFFSDGFHIRKKFYNRIWIALLIFCPPLVLSIIHPSIFITALSYAGGWGCSLLLGLLPILMVWSGRYIHKYKGIYKFLGGRVVLIILLLFLIATWVMMVKNNL